MTIILLALGELTSSTSIHKWILCWYWITCTTRTVSELALLQVWSKNVSMLIFYGCNLEVHHPNNRWWFSLWIMQQPKHKRFTSYFKLLIIVMCSMVTLLKRKIEHCTYFVVLFSNSIPLSLVSFNSFFQQQNCIPVLFRNYRELVDVQPNIQSSQRLYC